MATFRGFEGADIIATFNGEVIGELQAITYTATRNDAPIYEMGTPDPRSYVGGGWMALDSGHGMNTPGKRTPKLEEYEELKTDTLDKFFSSVKMKKNLVNEDYSALLNEGELF